jgi:hypothetical protein
LGKIYVPMPVQDTTNDPLVSDKAELNVSMSPRVKTKSRKLEAAGYGSKVREQPSSSLGRVGGTSVAEGSGKIEVAVDRRTSRAKRVLAQSTKEVETLYLSSIHAPVQPSPLLDENKTIDYIEFDIDPANYSEDSPEPERVMLPTIKASSRAPYEHNELPKKSCPAPYQSLQREQVFDLENVDFQLGPTKNSNSNSHRPQNKRSGVDIKGSRVGPRLRPRTAGNINSENNTSNKLCTKEQQTRVNMMEPTFDDSKEGYLAMSNAAAAVKAAVDAKTNHTLGKGAFAAGCAPNNGLLSPTETPVSESRGAQLYVGKENSTQLVGGPRGLKPQPWNDGEEFVVSGHVRQAWVEASERAPL